MKKKTGETDFYKRVASYPMNIFGCNGSGLAIGDDAGYRDKRSIETDRTPQHRDPLVKLSTVEWQERYYNLGFTKRRGIWLRQPVVRQVIEFDNRLHQQLDWSLRVCDGWRDSETQRLGFCWAVERMAKRYQLTRDEFVNHLSHVLSRRWYEEQVESGKRSEFLALRQQIVGILTDAEEIFSWVPTKTGYRRDCFPPDTPEILITGGANFNAARHVGLNSSIPTSHGSGGSFDIEILDAEGQLVLMGSPVDYQGVLSYMGFFEVHVPPALAPTLERLKIDDRLAYFYQELTNSKMTLRRYYESCGFNVDKLLASEALLRSTYERIRNNRRALLTVASACGLLHYKGEWWHFEGTNARGGVDAKELISGSTCVAVHLGQERGAWDNADRPRDAVLELTIR